eukprot:scaffold70771_cov122-Cyclotella_meneghiniana.AAC.1
MQSLSLAIQETIQQIIQLKREKRWKEADRFKMILRQKYSTQLFIRKDGTVGWAMMEDEDRSTALSAVIKNTWSLLQHANMDSPTGNSSTYRGNVPLVIATVDTPHYRSRLSTTLRHLSSVTTPTNNHESSSFHPIKTINMLPLHKHPSVGVNRIVFEGWRQILLPSILRQWKSLANVTDEEATTTVQCPIVFIAEDDVRFFSYDASKIIEICTGVLLEENSSELQILSLGHGYAMKKPSRRQRRRAKREEDSFNDENSSDNMGNTSELKLHHQSMEESSLLNHLQSGGKIHGSTFLALRLPTGVESLLDAMERIPYGKRSHFDQFLFHTNHGIPMAFSDPPLVGWAEVEETLTSVGSGCRRKGGGRKEFCPVNCENCEGIQWIYRGYSITG